LAAQQSAESLQFQMAEAASELQTQLTTAQQALLTEQQDHRDSRQTSEGQQVRLQATEERSLDLQSQLEKAQKQKSVDAQAHEDAIAECQRQVRAAEQTGSSLQTKWEAANQELASEKQAHQAAKQTVAEVQVELGKEASRARSLHQVSTALMLCDAACALLPETYMIAGFSSKHFPGLSVLNSMTFV